MTPTDPARPHVALAISGLHDVAGGAERVLVDVANGLHRRGYPVTVLTYQELNGPSFYPLDFGIRHLDGRKRHAKGSGRTPPGTVSGAARTRPWLARVLWALQYGPKIASFRRLLRIARPDVVIGFLPSTFPYLAISAATTRTPFVASLHNVPERDLGGDPLRWDRNPVDIAMRKRALHTSAANTVLLPSFVEQLEPTVRHKTYVVPNLVHPFTGELADVRATDDNVILAVGRLSPAKDHATLIRAWAELEQRHPTWRVRIVGSGPLRRDLERLIDELGVDRVDLDPPTDAIDEVYVSSKLLAMPSVHEGFGLVTAEALARGLPVVGFADCEGTNEIVLHEENGLLVDPGDDRAAAFAQSLERLMDDDELRSRCAAAAPASVERFGAEPIIDAWVNVIDDVVDGTVGS